MLEDLSSLDALGGDQAAEGKLILEMVGEEVIVEIGLVLQLFPRSYWPLLPLRQDCSIVDLVRELLLRLVTLLRLYVLRLLLLRVLRLLLLLIFGRILVVVIIKSIEEGHDVA